MSDSPSSSGQPPGRALSAELLHDLCTPLNHIIGYSEMLTEQAQDEGQTSFVPDLEEIRDAAGQMLALLTSTSMAPAEGIARSEGPGPVAPEIPSPLPEPLVSGFYAPDITGAQILVVDDNRRNRDMLSRRLERQGYSVALAEDGRGALEAVRARPFDLVLLDIMMPAIDGYEVLRQIKTDETLRAIPVIMISALDEMDSVVRCIEMGADDYLPKPFNPVLLKARIGACLEKKRAHDLALRVTAELQSNYDRLRELEKLRDDLTNMIVHDLRTPLTSVIGGMQALSMMGELDETQDELVNMAVEGGDTLLAMINDLLDVEQMESGSMQLEYASLDAARLVNDAAGQVASLLKNKDLHFVSQIESDLPAFYGDDNKLRRVLVNLLGNAIKFTPTGGSITAAVRHDEDGRALVFSVTDTGEGIPAEAFERIFDKFGQVESRLGGRTMSTGLGLTFCKLAVETHGGTIGVESRPGQGSTFRFTIPQVALSS